MVDDGEGRRWQRQRSLRGPRHLPSSLGWAGDPRQAKGRVWEHSSRIMESARSLFPRGNPTIKFFKEVDSRREQGQHPCTAQTSIAHPQPSCPRTPGQTPNFPPLLLPPSKAGKNKQLVQSEGSQNNERKSRVGNPIPIHAAGKKVQPITSCPQGLTAAVGIEGANVKGGETASQESFGAGFTPCKSQTRASALSFRPPEGSQLRGGMNSARSASPQ